MGKFAGFSLVTFAILAGCSQASNGSLPATGSQPSSLSSSQDVVPLKGADDKDHMMIADQFNNRVIEIDRQHKIMWKFGDGSSKAGPHSIVAPNDEERYGDMTLIAGTGAPAGTEPGCMKVACQDNRVILVNKHGDIVWQYGKTGIPGSGHDELNTPVCDVALPNGDVLITDQANERVIEVTMDKRIVWQYGMTGVTGSGNNQLNNPNCAELLANGRILIADENNNRVIEVTRGHNIVWQYGSPNDTKTLNGAAFASRLDNGNTLITDSLNNRIVEVDHNKNVVWTYVTNTRPGSVANPNPTRAVRLRNGNTLISDQFNHQVIEVNHAGNIVFSQGQVGVSGRGYNLLNAPYDAKIVGDFTGLTPPH
ncbi:MAG TPA: hypothetical protein VFE35_01305 [Candidatus Cybelea sp.]|jgi:hypothetical protein|nr:hypothetical protein [Candidatus Cybelea sp.]